jgi:hypothetical protein
MADGRPHHDRALDEPSDPDGDHLRKDHSVSGLDLFERPSVSDDGARNANDYYPTPAWMTLSLLAHHRIDGTVLEPCAGDGAVARVLEQSRHVTRVLTNDVDSRHQATFHHDAAGLGLELWLEPDVMYVDWVVTNPPFNIAFQIIERAVLLPRASVAMLLRKTFLEPTQERGAWLAAHPPTRIIGLPRHSFRGKGNDSVSADWFIWEKYRSVGLPPVVIDHLAKTRKVTF